MQYFENRFYRSPLISGNGLSEIKLAVIPVEDAGYWNSVACGILVDVGEVLHFDTLYDKYLDSLIDDLMASDAPVTPVKSDKPVQKPRLLEGLTAHPTTFCHFDTEIYLGQYVEDCSPAIFGRIKGGEFAGQPAWVATVRLPGLPPSEGCVWIKTWAENDGLLDELIRIGLLSITGRAVETGRGAVAIECRLLA